MVKVINTKKYKLHALNTLMTDGNKLSHIPKSKPTTFSSRFV